MTYFQLVEGCSSNNEAREEVEDKMYSDLYEEYGEKKIRGCDIVLFVEKTTAYLYKLRSQKPLFDPKKKGILLTNLHRRFNLKEEQKRKMKKEYVVSIVLKPMNNSMLDIKKSTIVGSEKEARALKVLMENIFSMPGKIRKATKKVFDITDKSFQWDAYNKVEVKLNVLITTSNPLD